MPDAAGSRCRQRDRPGARPRATPPGLKLLSADVIDPATLSAAAAQLEDAPPVDLLIYATGVLQDDQCAPEMCTRNVHRKCAPEKSLADIDACALAVNATGFALTLAALRSRLQLRAPLHVAALSARVGSIADSRADGWYGYRASKSALNMLVRTSALELGRHHRDAVCVAVHPGTVATRLSEPHVGRGYRHRVFTAEQAAAQLLDVIAAAGRDANGTFLARDGTPIPW